MRNELSLKSVRRLSLKLQVTSEESRFDAQSSVRGLHSEADDLVPVRDGQQATWLYVLGPAGLLSAVEDTCIEWRRRVKQDGGADATEKRRA